jgi:hypothetical protein
MGRAVRVRCDPVAEKRGSPNTISNSERIIMNAGWVQHTAATSCPLEGFTDAVRPRQPPSMACPKSPASSAAQTFTKAGIDPCKLRAGCGT